MLQCDMTILVLMSQISYSATMIHNHILVITYNTQISILLHQCLLCACFYNRKVSSWGWAGLTLVEVWEKKKNFGKDTKKLVSFSLLETMFVFVISSGRLNKTNSLHKLQLLSLIVQWVAHFKYILQSFSLV